MSRISCVFSSSSEHVQAAVTRVSRHGSTRVTSFFASPKSQPPPFHRPRPLSSLTLPPENSFTARQLHGWRGGVGDGGLANLYAAVLHAGEYLHTRVSTPGFSVAPVHECAVGGKGGRGLQQWSYVHVLTASPKRWQRVLKHFFFLLISLPLEHTRGILCTIRCLTRTCREYSEANERRV